MPLPVTDFPVRSSATQRLEQAPKPDAGIIRSDDEALVVVNDLDDFIMPGEPVPFGDTLGVFKKVVKPGQAATLLTNRVIDFRLNPAEAALINQGAKIYWDYDLSVADIPQPGQIPAETKTVAGWATAVAPTNGYFLGWARVPGEPTPENSVKTNPQSPVAAAVPASSIKATVCVVMRGAEQAQKFGTTPFDASTLGANTPTTAEPA